MSNETYLIHFPEIIYFVIFTQNASRAFIFIMMTLMFLLYDIMK